MRLLVSCLLALTVTLRAAEPFEIKEGDRVLFLGDTLLEREGTYGYLETRMQEQFPDRHFTVRNLAFSADTPLGWSRASFDPAAKGFERLKEQIDLVRPTVVFLGYGMAASLQEMTDRRNDPTMNPDPARYGAEPMSAERFKKELGQLMDAINESAARTAAIVPANAGNDRASLNGTAVRGTATAAEQSAAVTTAEAAAASTKPNPRDAAGGSPAPVRFVLLSPIRHEDLRSTRPGLPDPTRHNVLLEQYSKAIEELAQERKVRFINLWNGVTTQMLPNGPLFGDQPALTDNGIHLNKLGYELFVRSFDRALAWANVWPEEARQLPTDGPYAIPAPIVAKREALRTAIIRKNELFFHQWRPANSTYLFGFRKHEQGQNAKEMPMFDPLIEQAEAEIDRLKRAPDAKNPRVDATNPRVDAANPRVGAANPGLTSFVAPLNNAPLPKPDFTVAEGYQIELWAENPLLYKPTQMNWDAQGRLWVASSALYPQITPGGEATDTILVLEDTDRDGKADKSTVFAGGLLIPTGVQPSYLPGKDGTARYGCYVGQSTELLFFEDTDGDGKADKKRIVLSGFGTEDTHHIIHTLKRGPDRRLYFNQSVYIHSHMETPWGVVRLNSGGVLAWDPRTEKVEVVSKGLWNTWGHQFDEWGQSFQTDGAGSTGLTWSFPGATFAPFEGSRRTMQSISPGSYPKFAGLELIYSPHFPADWQGNAITCDFRAHRVVRFGVTDLSVGEKPQAGYTTQEMPDLVRTSDVAFRPIDVKLGPDGALYVADWSNPVINHGEVDFRDPRRDHTHGRIWRITKKDAPLVKWESLTKKKNPELLDGLLSPNLWEKEQSRALLGKRLVSEIENRKVEAKATGQVALGTEEATAGLSEVERWYQQDKSDVRLREVSLLESAFATTAWARFPALSNSTAPGNRALVPRLTAAMRSRATALTGQSPTAPTAPAPGATPNPDRPAPNLYSLPKLANDPNPRVRLETLRILARSPGTQAMDLILDAAVKNEGDPFLDYAAWLSVNDRAARWTRSIASGNWKIEGKEKQLEYGLNAIDPALAGTVLAQLLSDGKIALNKGPWLELFGKAGGPAELAAIFESLIISYGADCCPGRNMTAPRATTLGEPDALRAIAALLDAVRTRNVLPEGELSLADLATHAPAALRPGLTQLAGYWKTKDAPTFLPVIATAADAKPELRLAAIEALRALGGAEAQKTLESLCAPAQTFAIRRAALVALAAQKFPAAAPLLAPVLRAAPNENEALATWRQLLAVQGAVGALEKKFNDPAWARELPQPVIVAAFRASREAGRKAQSLTQVLTPLAGASAAQVFTAADYQRLAAASKTSGDPAQGELIYRRATSGCVTCHAIGGAGGIVGPSLTSIGASAPLDYIIESLLTPNAKVKEGYNAVTLKLKDGTEVTGIQARETAQEVILRNIAGHETAVPKANITGKTDVGSIMPAGLLEALSERERLNLYAFLGELGKPGPYDASKGSVARVWRLYSGAQDQQALKQDVSGFVPPVYTNVDGRLAQATLVEALPMVGDVGKELYATAQFQVATGGKVRLNLTGVSTAWLDGQPLAIASEPNPSPELAPGIHTLAVKLDRTALPAILRAEADGTNFLGN
jgi:putative heme-binding domain-containing protein